MFNVWMNQSLKFFLCVWSYSVPSGPTVAQTFRHFNRFYIKCKIKLSIYYYNFLFFFYKNMGKEKN
jgi:hypothetical protein